MLKRIAAAMMSLTILGMLVPKFAAARTTAPAPPQRVYELRIYTCNDGKLPELHARFRDHSMKLLARHGMENLYYWTILEGATTDGNDAKNMLVYLLGHKDRAAADASWAAFRADPEWQDVQVKSEANGKFLSKPVVSIFMSPTDFSFPDEPANATSNAPARLFELRQYNVGESGLPGTVDRFKAGEAELFRKNGMTTVAFWTAMDNSAFIYLLAHKDRETSRANWQTFFADFRQWQTTYNAARGAARGPASAPALARGPATAPAARRGGAGGGGNEIRFLVPTDYSPRK